MRSRRLAIVGCGAVTRLFHAPASVLVPGLELIGLADASCAAAEALATRYAVPLATDDYQAFIGRVDLVVVATPPRAHVEIVTAFLEAGVSVLGEKPLGRTAAECEAMLAAAARGGASLFVGHNRRLFPNRRLLRELLRLRALGDLQEVALAAGGEFRWPTATGYQFDLGSAGGGVLLDSGIHELDTLLWYWPDLRVESYVDDSLGGLESNCELRFTVEGCVPGVLRLSRTSALSNTLYISGAAGEAALATHETSRLRLRTSGAAFPGGPWMLEAPEPMGLLETFAAQLTSAFLTLEGQQPPVATAADALHLARIVDTCYAIQGARPRPTTAPLTGMPA